MAHNARQDATPFTPLSARIERFRRASRDRGVRAPVTPRFLNFIHAFTELYAGRAYWERYARSMAYALSNEPVFLLDDEWLVGQLYQTPADRARYAGDMARRRAVVQEAAGPSTEAFQPDPFVGGGGSEGHIGWRWDRVLALGIDGHTRDIRRRLDATEDRAARRLYRGSLILWRSVLAWNRRHVAALAQRAACAAGPERERLRRLIRICERVPRLPARTFREAIQSFHLQHLALMFENPRGGNGPGRLDLYLWPYLERDLAQGRITTPEAKDLIDELFIRFHERLQHSDGWVEAIAVGGLKSDGSSAVNPLSMMIIDSIAALDQTHPSVYPRIARCNPPAYVDQCVKYLLCGHNRAQIYSDESCVPAIRAGGVPLADARNYMAGGCMEISVQGAASDLNFARTHNVAKVLELVLNGGVDMLSGNRRIPHDRELPDYGSFEELYGAFEQELLREYADMVRAVDVVAGELARTRPCFMLSSLVDDCLERGREQQDGGARYHDYGFAPLGLTAVADALNAIRRAVYEDRMVSASRLLDAMRANYEGAEPLRLFLHAIPKFGVEDASADGMTQRVLRSVCCLATTPRNRFGGTLKPMVFNFTWTPGASAALGARADGALAGDVIGQGLTPRSCAMTRGITAAMNSVASLDTTCVWGGATTMWDVDDQWITFDLMKQLLLTFIERGGMIFQGNTTSVTDLRAALEHPEAYQHLIVRVGGYSARFVALDPALQAEVMARHRHAG